METEIYLELGHTQLSVILKVKECGQYTIVTKTAHGSNRSCRITGLEKDSLHVTDHTFFFSFPMRC